MKKTLKTNKGNRTAQRARQRKRRKNRPTEQKHPVMLVDGNFSAFPVAYCKYYKAYLTQGLVETHRCLQRKCLKFRKVVGPIEENEDLPS